MAMDEDMQLDLSEEEETDSDSLAKPIALQRKQSSQVLSAIRHSCVSARRRGRLCPQSQEVRIDLCATYVRRI